MKRLYAIFDKKAKSYGPIFGVPHDAVAIREFGAAVESPNSVLAKYPEDFELHVVGSFFDDSVMPVVGFEPTVVITASAYVASQVRESA